MRTKKKRLQEQLAEAGRVNEYLATKNWDLYRERSQLINELEEAWSDIIRLSSQNQALTKKLNYVYDVLEKSIPVLEENIQPAKGPDRPNRQKLTDQEVKDIRAAHRSGVKQKDLAENYGVARSTISRIVKGVYYK